MKAIFIDSNGDVEKAEKQFFGRFLIAVWMSGHYVCQFVCAANAECFDVMEFEVIFRHWLFADLTQTAVRVEQSEPSFP
jgi:hypothetical protein